MKNVAPTDGRTRALARDPHALPPSDPRREPQPGELAEVGFGCRDSRPIAMTSAAALQLVREYQLERPASIRGHAGRVLRRLRREARHRCRARPRDGRKADQSRRASPVSRTSGGILRGEHRCLVLRPSNGVRRGQEPREPRGERRGSRTRDLARRRAKLVANRPPRPLLERDRDRLLVIRARAGLRCCAATGLALRDECDRPPRARVPAAETSRVVDAGSRG